ncbi:MAG: DUF5060 domain-containing protein [Rikenellaceae bacterium]
MNKHTLFLLVLLLIFRVGDIYGAIKKADYSTKTITADKHEIIDIVFKAKKGIENPFETDFKAIFTSPTGKQQIVEGFFNGEDKWVIRFSASESGVWSYKTESGVKLLNEKCGNIEISTKNYGSRRGAIVINEQHPQNFFWQDGSPYFLMGFECDFLFALDYHNPDSTPKLDNLLNKVAENGFNHLVMNVYANDVVWVKDQKLKQSPQYEFGDDNSIFPFLGDNDNPDHSSLNIDFFNHLDRTMEALNDRNIISHLMIYVWNKNVSWAKTQSIEDNRYFDYVVKRYQAFSNVVWDVSKEAILYGNVGDEYILERIERLKEMDSYDRLVTVHDFGFCNRNRESVDFLSHQDWNGSLYNDMIGNYNKFKDKPILNVEHGGYEECDYEVFCGNYINAEYLLRRNYESIFAGIYSTYYWQGCSWNVIIHDWEKLPEGSYKPKVEYFKHLTDFFTKYPFHKFKPFPQYNGSGYAMYDGDKTYIVYMPKENYKTAANQLMKISKRLSFQWFNTHTGEYSEIYETDDMQIFAMPASPWHMKNDAIMIMKVSGFNNTP